MNGSVKRLTQDRPKPWRARYRGPDGRERSKTFQRRVEAERWLKDELGKADSGVWVDPSAGAVTSFAEWADGWLRGLTLKPKTRAGYESLLRSRVLPRFGAFPLGKITPAEVQTWQTGMLDEGLSPARVRQARQVLHAALEQAVTDGLIARNPTERVKPPKVRPRRQRFLTADQVEVLAAGVRGPSAGRGGGGDAVGLVGSPLG